MDFDDARPWALSVKKTKRCGPCDNCGCSASTQCGVCWGRKKKLPSVHRGGGSAGGATLLYPDHEAPASPLRFEEPAPAAHELAAADEAELELAGLLLAFASDRTWASQGARQRGARLARPPDESGAGAHGWARRRTSATLSSGAGAPRAADTPIVGAKRARAPTPEGVSPAAPLDAPADATKTLPPMTPVGSVDAAPSPATTAAAAAAFAPFLWHMHVQPQAFDIFRSVMGGSACWGDVHNAWMSVPPEVAAAYHAAASAAAYVAAGVPPLAMRAEPTAATQVLPSRVIAQPPAAVAPASG